MTFYAYNLINFFFKVKNLQEGILFYMQVFM